MPMTAWAANRPLRTNWGAALAALFVCSLAPAMCQRLTQCASGLSRPDTSRTPPLALPRPALPTLLIEGSFCLLATSVRPSARQGLARCRKSRAVDFRRQWHLPPGLPWCPRNLQQKDRRCCPRQGMRRRQPRDHRPQASLFARQKALEFRFVRASAVRRQLLRIEPACSPLRLPLLWLVWQSCVARPSSLRLWAVALDFLTALSLVALTSRVWSTWTGLLSLASAAVWAIFNGGPNDNQPHLAQCADLSGQLWLLTKTDKAVGSAKSEWRRYGCECFRTTNGCYPGSASTERANCRRRFTGGLWRLWHARSERSEDVVGGVGGAIPLVGLDPWLALNVQKGCAPSMKLFDHPNEG